MLRHFAVVCLLIGSISCQGDIDQVLAEIFGQPGNPSPGQNTQGGQNTQAGQAQSGQNNFGQTTRRPAAVTEASNTEENEPCEMESKVSGICVPYYLCNDANNTVITDGTDIIDIRIKDGPCKSYLDSCCLTGDTRPPNNPVTTAPTPTDQQRVGCGWRNPNGVGFRITGDKDGEAQFAEFPWMVAILTVEPVNEDQPDGLKLNVYLSGASLIHPSVVLTAAHYVAKVWKVKTLKARSGEWDTQTKGEAYPYQDSLVQDVKIHEDFNGGNLFNDVAVLFLEKPMTLAPNVGVVCLPPPRETSPPGTRCFASGWGKDQFEKEGRYQVILKKIELPIVDRNSCQSALRNTRLGNVFQLHSSFMCAGGEKGKDSCKGDGGSPLVCPVEFEQDRYVQSGIVAWGIGCGQDGVPGVYVEVAKFRDWIDNAVAGKGYDVSTYSVQ